MVLLNAVELIFSLSYRGAVSVHLFVGAIPILIELIDHESGIAIHLEAFHAELSSYTETMKGRLVFRGIIGCSKV